MKRCLFFLMTLALLTALACAEPEVVVTEEGKTLDKVVAVGSAWYGHLPTWAAIEKGYFEEAGFQVQWLPIGKSMDRLIALSSGDAHFASLGEIAMLSAMSRDNKAFYWVGNQDIAPGFEGLVGGPDVKTWEDLKGKTIGLPFYTSVDLTARLLLKENGLDPEKDVSLVNLEVGNVPAALAQGSVDAAVIWEPGFSELMKQEGTTLLGSDTDTVVYKEFGTMTGPDVLILSKSWVDADEERAKRFMAAYFKAVEWVRDNPDEAVEVVYDPKYIQQDKQVIKDNLKKFIWRSRDEQAQIMSDAGMYRQVDYVCDIFLNEIGGDTLAKKPAYRDWVRMDLVLTETPAETAVAEDPPTQENDYTEPAKAK